MQLLTGFIIIKNIFIKLLSHIGFIFWAIISIADAQVVCSGSWALNNPFSQACISGQHIGSLNPAVDPLGCPINPVYSSNQSNTYTFPSPVSRFTIDFKEFNSSPGCARIEVKINGIFYPLTNANITHFSHISTGPPCRSLPLNLAVTSDGYISSSSSGGIGTETLGGIIFSNINATSVSISTNDANGALFSDPYNCAPVLTFCSGSWALQRPIAVQCNSGQWVGWQNPGQPAGCPINPAYPGTETNKFTFTSPVSDFSIDFNGFDGQNQCSRMQLKVNDIFYHLTPSNLTPLPAGTECTGTSVMFVTSDGYIVSNSINSSGGGQGRITINGVNATSVSVSTNDAAGTLFTNPFSCNIIVPLKLESFTGMNKECQALLNWKTGVEQNVSKIEIQRSQDAITFTNIGRVAPKGSNSYYSFACNNTTTGYFRLKIIDHDGYYEYSNILNIKSDCSNTSYQVLPNPARSLIEIIGLTNNDKVFVLDMLGRNVLTFNSLQNNNKFDIQKLTPGMYILQVINNKMIKSNLKFIKN